MSNTTQTPRAKPEEKQNPVAPEGASRTIKVQNLEGKSYEFTVTDQTNIQHIRASLKASLQASIQARHQGQDFLLYNPDLGEEPLENKSKVPSNIQVLYFVPKPEEYINGDAELVRQCIAYHSTINDIDIANQEPTLQQWNDFIDHLQKNFTDSKTIVISNINFNELPIQPSNNQKQERQECIKKMFSELPLQVGEGCTLSNRYNLNDLDLSNLTFTSPDSSEQFQPLVNFKPPIHRSKFNYAALVFIKNHTGIKLSTAKDLELSDPKILATYEQYVNLLNCNPDLGVKLIQRFLENPSEEKNIATQHDDMSVQTGHKSIADALAQENQHQLLKQWLEYIQQTFDPTYKLSAVLEMLTSGKLIDKQNDEILASLSELQDNTGSTTTDKAWFDDPLSLLSWIIHGNSGNTSADLKGREISKILDQLNNSGLIAGKTDFKRSMLDKKKAAQRRSQAYKYMGPKLMALILICAFITGFYYRLKSYPRSSALTEFGWATLGLVYGLVSICLVADFEGNREEHLKSISLEAQNLENIKTLYETIMEVFTNPDAQNLNNSLPSSEQGNHCDYIALGINDNELSLNRAGTTSTNTKTEPQAYTFLARAMQAISSKTKPAAEQAGSAENPELNTPLL